MNRALMIFGWLLSVSACGRSSDGEVDGGAADAGPPCTFIGDPSQPVELKASFWRSDGVPRDLVENSDIPLIEAPQAGFILIATAMARNIDACDVQLTVSLRSPCTGKIVSLDRRTLRLSETPEGWGTPKLESTSDYANVPACPAIGFGRQINDQTYIARIAILDRDERSGELLVPVVPRCTDGDSASQSRCVCTCSNGYVLGGACGAPEPALMSCGT